MVRKDEGSHGDLRSGNRENGEIGKARLVSGIGEGGEFHG